MAGGVEIVFRGTHEMAAGFARLSVRAEMASKEAVHFTALALVRQAKINSTGPPRLARTGTTGARPGTGPGVVSGRHRNSIRIVEQGPVGRFGWFADVAPTMVYSRRLELGFTGTDSLGRNYNQPAYPYLAPALHFVHTYVAEPAFRRAWSAALTH